MPAAQQVAEGPTRHGVVDARLRAGQCSACSGLSGPQDLQVVFVDPLQCQQGRGLPAGGVSLN